MGVLVGGCRFCCIAWPNCLGGPRALKNLQTSYCVDVNVSGHRACKSECWMMWQCWGVAGYSMIGLDFIFKKYWLNWAAHRRVVPLGPPV
eukprot:8687486-Heterocapsa_arctica.AAC.1